MSGSIIIKNIYRVLCFDLILYIPNVIQHLNGVFPTKRYGERETGVYKIGHRWLVPAANECDSLTLIFKYFRILR